MSTTAARPKIHLKRTVKQGEKAQAQQPVPTDYLYSANGAPQPMANPESVDLGYSHQSLVPAPPGQPQQPFMTQNDIEVKSFYDEQSREEVEAERKLQEQKEKAAAKNQLSRAQRDMKEDRCDDCGKVNCLVVKQHEGTLVCTECGVVSQNNMIDQYNEKRVFSSDLHGADQNSGRIKPTSGNPSLPQHDHIVIEGNSKAAKELKNYAMTKYDGYERNLVEGHTKIRLLAESLNLNHADVKALAIEYLKKIEDTKVLKGKSLDAKVGCVMFYAARNTKKGRKATQILHYITSSERELNKCFKKCKELLKFVPLPPSQIVENTCQQLGLPPEIMRAGKITGDNFSRYALCEGKRPQTIAGVSLLMVMQCSKKHKDNVNALLEKVSKNVGISSATIKETYGSVMKYRDKLLPEYLTKGNNGLGGLSLGTKSGNPVFW